MNNTCYSQSHSPFFPEEEQGEWVWVPRKLALTVPGYPAVSHQSQCTDHHIYPPFETGSLGVGVSAMPWDPTRLTSRPPPVENDVPSTMAGSPAEPPLEGFDIDLALQLYTSLGDPEQQEVSVPQDTVSMDLFSCMDVDLFSGVDLTLTPESVAAYTAPDDTVSPTSTECGTLSFASDNSPSMGPLTPPSSAGASPDSTSPAPAKLLPCPDPSCSKIFDKLPSLRKHERKHRQPFRCALCGKGHLDNRALARHLWAKHPEYARQSNVRSEKVKCPRCEYQGRRDNVVRHMKRHAKDAR
ncbi:hypothetical protein VTK56DRAFT_5831 [Thermocarpiscus australiensis]